MKPAFLRNVALAIVALSLPSAVSAQAPGAEQIDQVRKDARAHFGPLYVTPTDPLKELGVDSNVFNAAGGTEVGLHVHPGAEGRRVGADGAPRALPGHRGAPTWSGTRQHDSERSIDPQFADRGEAYLRRMTLFGGERVPQHAPAAELRDRPALPARREQRRRPASPLRLTPKFSHRSGGPPSATPASTPTRSSTASACSHAQPGDHRLQRLDASTA